MVAIRKGETRGDVAYVRLTLEQRTSFASRRHDNRRVLVFSIELIYIIPLIKYIYTRCMVSDAWRDELTWRTMSTNKQQHTSLGRWMPDDGTHGKKN